jgi:hypothetical protein
MSIELVIAVLMAVVAILVGFAGPAPEGARAEEVSEVTGLPAHSSAPTREA